MKAAALRLCCCSTILWALTEAFLVNISRQRRRTVQQHRHRAIPTNTKELGVQVYDHAFSKSACEDLHELAQDHCERGGVDGSSIFYRHSKKQLLLTPLERALDSFLTTIGDDSEIVEYWSRQEYINLEVHSDLDEDEFEDLEQIQLTETEINDDDDDSSIASAGMIQARFPISAHVLYLQCDKDVHLSLIHI